MDRADLAESMVPVACDLACRVRDGDAEGIERLAAASGWDTETAALLVVLAAMIPVDCYSPNDLLAWTGALEAGPVGWRQDPLMAPVELEPCPSLAAYRRHQRAGEPGEECGCHEAAKAEWREKKRRAARQAVAEDDRQRQGEADAA